MSRTQLTYPWATRDDTGFVFYAVQSFFDQWCALFYEMPVYNVFTVEKSGLRIFLYSRSLGDVNFKVMQCFHSYSSISLAESRIYSLIIIVGTSNQIWKLKLSHIYVSCNKPKYKGNWLGTDFR